MGKNIEIEQMQERAQAESIGKLIKRGLSTGNEWASASSNSPLHPELLLAIQNENP